MRKGCEQTEGRGNNDVITNMEIVEPNEETLELLGIPIEIEGQDLGKIPSVSTIYNDIENPSNYLVTDTNSKIFLVYLELSEDEKNCLDKNIDHMNRYGYIDFNNPSPEEIPTIIVRAEKAPEGYISYSKIESL